jgi:alcohol dehydrogenase/acrylyl-CoA reductase (NADPH)
MKRREFIWSQAASLIDMNKLDEITQVWSMEKLISSYDKILKGEVAGRVVIDVNQ